jgi:hypothetical protein
MNAASEESIGEEEGDCALAVTQTVATRAITARFIMAG